MSLFKAFASWSSNNPAFWTMDRHRILCLPHQDGSLLTMRQKKVLL
ncbi:rCG60536 [Rattus norvegicus]|uniref:RCG60536 n=1 Tax=Rattus norvegicus TaxID=10116 RepID=A6JK57_RAT|nr:rCG60536 [Rattus norvegicus]